eukprot:g2618.t1
MPAVPCSLPSGQAMVWWDYKCTVCGFNTQMDDRLNETAYDTISREPIEGMYCPACREYNINKTYIKES